MSNNSKSNLSREADVLAEVYFFTEDEGGRRKPCSSGYRPAHRVKEDYLTTGSHFYLKKELVYPHEKVKTWIKFITPEYYPKCLWIGKEIDIQEGARVVGKAKILELYNKSLEK